MPVVDDVAHCARQHQFQPSPFSVHHPGNAIREADIAARVAGCNSHFRWWRMHHQRHEVRVVLHRATQAGRGIGEDVVGPVRQPRLCVGARQRQRALGVGISPRGERLAPSVGDRLGRVPGLAQSLRRHPRLRVVRHAMTMHRARSQRGIPAIAAVAHASWIEQQAVPGLVQAFAGNRLHRQLQPDEGLARIIDARARRYHRQACRVRHGRGRSLSTTPARPPPSPRCPHRARPAPASAAAGPAVRHRLESSWRRDRIAERRVLAAARQPARRVRRHRRAGGDARSRASNSKSCRIGAVRRPARKHRHGHAWIIAATPPTPAHDKTSHQCRPGSAPASTRTPPALGLLRQRLRGLRA